MKCRNVEDANVDRFSRSYRCRYMRLVWHTRGLRKEELPAACMCFIRCANVASAVRRTHVLYLSINKNISLVIKLYNDDMARDTVALGSLFNFLYSKFERS